MKKAIVGFLFAMAIWYILIAFITDEFNPTKWSVLAKSAMVLIFAVQFNEFKEEIMP